MTKKTMIKASDQQQIMITNLRILTCDTKLAEKNAVAHEKALQTFEKNQR